MFRRRRWVVEEEMGGRDEKIGGGECLGAGDGGDGSRGGDRRRRWRGWVVEEIGGGDGEDG